MELQYITNNLCKTTVNYCFDEMAGICDMMKEKLHRILTVFKDKPSWLWILIHVNLINNNTENLLDDSIHFS